MRCPAGGSNGAAGWTGNLVGASMRIVSMRVVILPPRSEGLPAASSQTVQLDGASFPFSLFGGGAERSNSFRPARPLRLIRVSTGK